MKAKELHAMCEEPRKFSSKIPSAKWSGKSHFMWDLWKDLYFTLNIMKSQ